MNLCKKKKDSKREAICFIMVTKTDEEEKKNPQVSRHMNSSSVGLFFFCNLPNKRYYLSLQTFFAYIVQPPVTLPEAADVCIWACIEACIIVLA